MSMTLMERHGVATNSSVVHSSNRWRVARPRRPGTRPSVVAISSGSSAGGMAAHGTEGRLDMTDRQIGHPRRGAPGPDGRTRGDRVALAVRKGEIPGE